MLMQPKMMLLVPSMLNQNQFQDVWTHHVPPRRAPYFLRAASTDGYADGAYPRESDLIEIKAKELVARVCRAEKRRAAAA